MLLSKTEDLIGEKNGLFKFLLALSLIFTNQLEFLGAFNHLAKPYLPASREFFQILL